MPGGSCRGTNQGQDAHIHHQTLTSSHTPQDLVSLKAFEHFQPLECDEVHGNDNVSAVGDDFTVETSLEDLEFGFSITKSTQKV